MELDYPSLNSMASSDKAAQGLLKAMCKEFQGLKSELDFTKLLCIKEIDVHLNWFLDQLPDRLKCLRARDFFVQFDANLESAKVILQRPRQVDRSDARSPIVLRNRGPFVKGKYCLDKPRDISPKPKKQKKKQGNDTSRSNLSGDSCEYPKAKSRPKGNKNKK